jgi:hypothetical protein
MQSTSTNVCHGAYSSMQCRTTCAQCFVLCLRVYREFMMGNRFARGLLYVSFPFFRFHNARRTYSHVITEKKLNTYSTTRDIHERRFWRIVHSVFFVRITFVATRICPQIFRMCVCVYYCSAYYKVVRIGTREEPGTLTQGVALFSQVPLVWGSNPQLQGGDDDDAC